MDQSAASPDVMPNLFLWMKGGFLWISTLSRVELPVDNADVTCHSI